MDKRTEEGLNRLREQLGGEDLNLSQDSARTSANIVAAKEAANQVIKASAETSPTPKK